MSLIKLVVLGDAKSGKSSLLRRLVDDSYSDNYAATIGVDFRIKNVNIEGKRLKFQAWDTSGNAHYATLMTAYYRGAGGIILCYDVNDRKTFESLDRFMDNIAENCSKDAPVVLVGNKCDGERQVAAAEGKEFARAHHCLAFLETSSKNNVNVDEVLAVFGRNAVNPSSDMKTAQREAAAKRAAIAKQKEIQAATEKCKGIFNVLDADNSGFIDESELKNALRELGEYLDDEEIKACLAVVDTSKDGKISLDEFTAWYVDDSKIQGKPKAFHRMALLAFRYHSSSDIQYDNIRACFDPVQNTGDSHKVTATIGDYEEPTDGDNHLGLSLAFNTKNVAPCEVKKMYAVYEFESPIFPGFQTFWKNAIKAVQLLLQEDKAPFSIHCTCEEKTGIVRLAMVANDEPRFEDDSQKAAVLLGFFANLLTGHSVDVDLGFSVADLAAGTAAPLSFAKAKVEVKGAIPPMMLGMIGGPIQMVQQMIGENAGLQALVNGDAQVDIKIEASSFERLVPPGMLPPNLNAVIDSAPQPEKEGVALFCAALSSFQLMKPLALHVRTESHLGAEITLRNFDLTQVQVLLEKVLSKF